MSKQMLTFTIPCYNSKDTVGTVIGSIHDVMVDLPDYDYEIICVNDSSPDSVYETIKEIARKDPYVRGLSLAKNVGKHAALMTAYRYVKGDIVIAVDDDGQTPIDQLKDLLEPLEKGYDVSVASYYETQTSFLKKLTSDFNDFTVRKLLGKPKGLKFSSFIARKRFVTDAMIQYTGPYPYLEGATLAVTRNIASVEMKNNERLSGSSNFTLRKGLALWVNGCTTYSYTLLKIGKWFSLLCWLCAIASLVALMICADKLFFLGLTSAFALGGTVLFYLLILSEYLGRLYMTANHIPQATVRESTFE